MKNRIFLSVIMIVFMIMLAGCGAENTDNAEINEEVQNVEPLQQIFDAEYYPTTDGTASTTGIDEAFFSALTGSSRTDACTRIMHTGNAINNLITGNAYIIFVETNPDTLYKMAKEAGVEIEVIPIAEDYFVFYDDSEGDKPVKASEKDENSKYNITSDTAKDIIYGKNTDSGLKYKTGYELSGYLPENIKLYSIDGVAPTADNVKAGEYEFTYFCYAAIRADMPENSAERKIIKAMLSDAGQALMEDEGYVKIQN